MKLERVIGKKTESILADELKLQAQSYAKTLVDLGTGDGMFAYRYARNNEDTFVLGFDAAKDSLQKASAKAIKKPAKGGCANAQFYCMNVLTLPDELTNLADTVHINFPWGSLMYAAYQADESFMTEVKKICKQGATYNFYINTYVFENQTQREDMQLEPFTEVYVKEKLVPRLNALGFNVQNWEFIAPEDLKDVPSTWAGQLTRNSKRNSFRLTAIVDKEV